MTGRSFGASTLLDGTEVAEPRSSDGFFPGGKFGFEGGGAFRMRG